MGQRWSADWAHHLAGAEPVRIWFHEGYDRGMSHRLFAGSDLLLMPSRFEPCGLTQMQAMRYGAIPVVTAVGGLVDTVTDADLHRNGTGFVAGRVASEDLLAALFRAERRVRDRRRRTAMQRRIMAIDWSWDEPAREYERLYGELAVNTRNGARSLGR